MSTFPVSAELASEEQGAGVCLIKLQSPNAELNVWVPLTELPKLLGIEDANWEDRATLQVGSSAASKVFWTCGHGYLTVMVGPDDEAWDFCLSLPVTCVSDLLTEVHAVASEAGLNFEGE
jgi:hypothetical protein